MTTDIIPDRHFLVPVVTEILHIQVPTTTTDYSPSLSKTGAVWLVLGRRLLDLLQADSLVLSGKIVVGRKEKHAMALLPFSHGDARAVPEPLRGLGGLVVVMPAGAERSSELILVVSKPLDDDGGDGLVGAEEGAGAAGVLLRELAHYLQRLVLRRRPVGGGCPLSGRLGSDGAPAAPPAPGDERRVDRAAGGGGGGGGDRHHRRRGGWVERGRGKGGGGGEGDKARGSEQRRRGTPPPHNPSLHSGRIISSLAPPLATCFQIGRASCRERVS